MSKKAVSVIKHSLVAVLLAIAIFAVFISAIAFESWSDFFSDFLGDIIGDVYFVILPFFALALPFIVKFLKKTSFKQFLISAILSLICYILILFITVFAGHLYFSKFSPEKWADFPAQRHIMLYDLHEKHKLIGMTKDELQELLGDTPEFLIANTDSTVSYRLTGDPLIFQKITFTLTDGKVSSWEIIEVNLFDS